MRLVPDIFYEDNSSGLGFASLDAAAGYEVLVGALKRRPARPEGLDSDVFSAIVRVAAHEVDASADAVRTLRWAGNVAFPGLHDFEQEIIDGRLTIPIRGRD